MSSRRIEARAPALILVLGLSVLPAAASAIHSGAVTNEAFTAEGNRGDAGSAARGLIRVWSTNMANLGRFPLFNDVLAREEKYPLTAAARRARDAWDPVEDNPYLGCTPMGMTRVMGQPYPIEFVDRGDEILLRIELYDIERVIYMGAADSRESTLASASVYSVGRWMRNSLEVDTPRVNWPYFDQSGVPQSDAVEIVERFTPSNDGNRLDYTITVTDPETFTAPVSSEKYWVWRPGETVNPFECSQWEGTDAAAE